jgi:hypothetical protein
MHRWTDVELAALDDLILEIAEEDHPLTVRSMFYRVVSAGGAPKAEESYRRIMRRVLHLRRSGALPYGYITDGSRLTYRPDVFRNGYQAVHSAHRFYRRDLWQAQDTYVEIWSEKDAISSVIWPTTDDYGVPLLVTRGYASESFLHNSAQVIKAQGKPTVIYQLGDHDPSGVDAWRATQERLQEFCRMQFDDDPDGAHLEFERLAVTPEQIADMQLPTRPTKSSDTRAKGFDGNSIEVDAIPSPTLRSIVADAITSRIDARAWAIEQQIEAGEKEDLFALIDSYDEQRGARFE